MSSHLTIQERDLLARLHHQGFEQKKIATAARACPLDDQPRTAA